MKINKKLNQIGASAIMLTMVLIIVVSLISLGFATVARRDQRSTLDKNISSEAQLVGESAVNSVKAYFDSKVKSGGAPEAKPKCDSVVSDYIPPQVSSANGPEVTCITWTADVPTAIKDLGAVDTWSFEVSNPSSPTITFQPRGIVGDDYGENTGRRSMPSQITESKMPILKVVTVNKDDIVNTSNPKIEVFYLVPSNKSTTTPQDINLGDGTSNANTNGNGSVFGVGCSSYGLCQVNVSGYPIGGGSRLFFFQNISSKPITVTYSHPGGSVSGVQAKVDANIKINDQSKRVVAGIQYPNTIGVTQTWQPWFAVITDQLCKDIKVDGTNDKGIISATACPN